jgi:hypothetical protein
MVAPLLNLACEESEGSMHRKIVCGARVFCSSLLVAILVDAAHPVRTARADQNITDPQSWCEGVAQLVGNKEIDKLVAEVTDSSRGTLRSEDIAQTVAPMGPFLARLGQLWSIENLGYRHYGTRVTRAWYVVNFDKAAVFVRCQLVLGDDVWTLAEFFFHTNPDMVAAPSSP